MTVLPCTMFSVKIHSKEKELVYVILGQVSFIHPETREGEYNLLSAEQYEGAGEFQRYNIITFF